MLASGKILKLLNVAGAQAAKSDMSSKHGSVCVHSRKILSLGHNSKRMRYLNHNSCSLHAEVSSLINLRIKGLKGSQGLKGSKPKGL